jgi:hypothetical protein
VNGSELRDFDTFVRSLRSHDWLKGVVPGATDIDVLIHNGRRHDWLLVEGKHRDGPTVWMPSAQWWSLMDLAKLPQFTVWVVAEDETSKQPGDVPGYHLLEVGGRSGGRKTTRHGMEVIQWSTERTTWESLTLAQLQAKARQWWDMPAT